MRRIEEAAGIIKCKMKNEEQAVVKNETHIMSQDAG